MRGGPGRRRWASWIAMAAFTVVGSPAPAAERPELDTLGQIGPALLACWRPPAEVGDYEVRVRFSLRRDGTVFGEPRIVFSRFLGGATEQRLIVRAVVDALAACTPLRLSPSLGGAVAGRPLTIRFGPPQRRA